LYIYYIDVFLKTSGCLAESAFSSKIEACMNIFHLPQVYIRYLRIQYVAYLGSILMPYSRFFVTQYSTPLRGVKNKKLSRVV